MEHSLAWKTLAKRTIFKDKWVNLEASDCELPDGRVIAPFYVYRASDFAVVVAVTEQGELVIERQYRHGIEKVIWELPAGAIEPGEDPQEAANVSFWRKQVIRLKNWSFCLSWHQTPHLTAILPGVIWLEM